MVTANVATLTRTTGTQRVPRPVSVEECRKVPIATPVTACPARKPIAGSARRPGAASAYPSPASIAANR
jgi:hypothetical protein